MQQSLSKSFMEEANKELGDVMALSVSPCGVEARTEHTQQRRWIIIAP